jgi:hypothetical protein
MIAARNRRYRIEAMQFEIVFHFSADLIPSQSQSWQR